MTVKIRILGFFDVLNRIIYIFQNFLYTSGSQSNKRVLDFQSNIQNNKD